MHRRRLLKIAVGRNFLSFFHSIPFLAFPFPYVFLRLTILSLYLLSLPILLPS